MQRQLKVKQSTYPVPQPLLRARACNAQAHSKPVYLSSTTTILKAKAYKGSKLIVEQPTYALPQHL